MPQELPGFYYDPEKNRYFPIKGPIPGTKHKSASSSQKPSPLPTKVIKSTPKKDNRDFKLLQYRELYGSNINFSSGKGNFHEEYKKKLASRPKVWRYEGVDMDADRSLWQVQISVQTPEGQFGTDALLAGAVNGCVSLYDVGAVGEHFNHGVKTTADFVWPERNGPDCSERVKDIWKFDGVTLMLPSTISCISVPRKEYFYADNDGLAVQRALVTTLGSELCGGSVYVFNLADPVDLDSSTPAIVRLRELASLNCTIWGADSNCSGRAVVGTNLGASLVDMETAVSSMLCSSKSDVLSVQLIQSGNVALCGLRNGAVVTVDVRQQQRQLARHRIPYPSGDSSRTVQKKTKPWFMLRGNLQPSCTVHMPSSVCCLASLRTFDQYFLASSMDGSIRLYDHRLTKRGPVQSYEGHVNSHSHIQVGIDASERFIMSGGEDGKVRIWSIKSGEMLFEEKLSCHAPQAICWHGSGGFPQAIDDTQSLGGGRYAQAHSSDAWLGSVEGLLRMQFP